MYVMDNALGWKPMAIFFAAAVVLSSFGTGSMPQVNNIAQVMRETFDFNEMAVGGVASILLGFVIIGGITRIAGFASRVVPAMAALYLAGALCVIISNYEKIVPSFLSIFTSAFTGSSAMGGFLGATFAFAANKGVGRGLFSNEAGQGSSAIAHASATTEEPVSEGMVSLLEPFIDTIIICTLTGLVILSSGVWLEKHENTFQKSDFSIISGSYSDTVEEDKAALYKHLNFMDGSTIRTLDGEIDIVDGKMITNGATILNARSVAENVVFSKDNLLYSGKLSVIDGNLGDSSVVVRGKSLIHSAALTSKAFTRSFLGDGGQYIVAVSLALFAFSTAVAWSYYGDRAIIYLFGPKGILPYRLAYVIGFFVASFADTTVIWTFAAITVAFMTIPNVICMFMMRKEVNQMVSDYSDKIK